MAQQPVNNGSIPGDGQGESLFSAFGKVNDNDAELFGAKTEFVANAAALPATGEAGKIYVTLDDDAMYRWTGTGYDDLGGIQFVANAAALPATGEALKIYITIDTGRLYRWAGAAYVDLCGLQFDEAGNIIANVVPRHDTLAALLLVADAGEGEIASASDKDALVVFKGGVGGVYWKSELVAESLVLGTMNVTTGALVHFDLTNKSTIGFFDNVGNVNLTDNTLDAVDGAQITHLEISAAVAFPAGDGTKRRAEIQCDITGGGVWANILTLQGAVGGEVVVANITGEVITAQVQGFSAHVATGGALVSKRFRLAVSHDATGTLNGVIGYIRQRAFKRT